MSGVRWASAWPVFGGPTYACGVTRSTTTIRAGAASTERRASRGRGELFWRRVSLAVELLIVFIALPTAFRLGWINLPLIGAIVILAASAAAFLIFDKTFDHRRFWRLRTLPMEAPRILGFFAIGAAMGVGAVLLASPDEFLGFVRHRPEIWAMVMLLYPIFSVYPQEVIFRGFFFHRYQPLFRQTWLLIGASALVFGYVHIVMGNGLSVVLSALGGVLFGWTYLRTQSLLAASFEHALYGCFIFTVGLGRYFYLAPG